MDEFVNVTIVCQSNSNSIFGLEEEFVWLKQTSPSMPAELVLENSRIRIIFEQDTISTSMLIFTPVETGDTATYICLPGPTVEDSILLTVRGRQKYGI